MTRPDTPVLSPALYQMALSQLSDTTLVVISADLCVAAADGSPTPFNVADVSSIINSPAERVFVAFGWSHCERTIRAAFDGKPSRHEHQINGRTYACVAQPVADAPEPQVLLVLRDITPHRQLENQLEASEAWRRSILDNATDIIYAVLADTKGLFYVNPAVTTVTGYTPDDFYSGRIRWDWLIHPDDRERVEAAVRAITTTGTLDVEYRITDARGALHWMHNRAWRVYAGDGTHVRTDGITRDITAAKEAELALRASEERYRLLSESTSDYAFMQVIQPDDRFRLEWMTESFTRITGYQPHEIYPNTAVRLYHPDDQARVDADMNRLRAGETFTTDYRIITKSGETRWIRLLRRPLEHIRPLLYYGMAQDITAAKEAELALRASEERYRIVTGLSSDYAFAVRVLPDGSLDPKPEWVTDSFTRITGYQPDETSPSGGYSIFHPDSQAQSDADIQRVLKGETVTGDYRILTKEGAERWLRLTRRPEHDETSGRIVRYYGSAQDITEQKEAETQLRESEARYRLLADNASDTISRMQLDTTLTYISPAIDPLLGYLPDEVIGTPLADLVHPDDRAAFREQVRTSLHFPDRSTWNCRLLHRDGRVLHIEMTNRVLRHPGTGEPTEIVSVTRDVTARQQAQMRELDFQLEKERTRLLTDFITNVSHDFRTPLSIIHTSLHLLSRTDDPERRAHHSEKAAEQARQIENLVDSVLTMVKLDSGVRLERTPVDVNMVLGEALRVLAATIATEGVAVEQQRGEALPFVAADPTELRRALACIIDNALHFTPEGGRVTLTTALRDAHVLVEIADTGIGISPKDLPHIFERLYKPQDRSGSGAGLGLAIASKVVEAFDGFITVESRVGVGSTFRVWLPPA